MSVPANASTVPGARAKQAPDSGIWSANMDYAWALKKARDHFGTDALAIRGGEVSPLSELIEQADSDHTGSPGAEATLDTYGEIESISGKRIPAWAITPANPQAQPLATGGAEAPLLVVARRDLLGDSRIKIEP